MLASRSIFIQNALNRLKRALGDTPKNQDCIIDVVNTINALLIPRGWVGLDESQRLHYTYIGRMSGGIALSYNAHFIWRYVPHDQTYICDKTTSTDWQLGCSYKCIPRMQCGKVV